ncbi:MAG: GYF domain-containing protein [Polyangiales bacterium]
MNFVCDRCKQKYHVADEKLRGRAVTRFRCKKCEHVIELDLAASESPTVEAPTVAAPTAPRPAARPIGTAPVSRPRSATMVGNAISKPAPRPRAATVTGAAVGAAMGAAARPMAKAPAERSTSAILNASENGWYAGIRDLPVGPLTRKELLAKVQSGDVSADTLVWREGLDDWRPLRNVAELGDMLRVGAQKLSGDLLDEMGKRPVPPRSARVVPISTARSGPARPAVHDEDEEATRVTGLDPAIAAMAAKALSRATSPPESTPEPAPEGDGEDETLVARQRAAMAPIAPAAKLGVEDLAHGPTVDTGAERPAPPDALAAPERPAAQAAPATTSTPPAPNAHPPSDFGLDDLPENLFASAPKVDPAALAPPNASTVNLGGASAVGLTTPSLAPVAMPSAPPTPMPTSMPAPAPQPRGGLSVPVILLIGGVLVAGMGMGIYIGRQNGPAPAPAAPPPAAVTPPAPPAPTVGETVALTAPTTAPEAPPELNPTTAPETPPEANPEQVTPEQVNPSGSHASRSHAPTRRAQPAQGTITAAEAAALRELGAQPSGAAGGPVGNTQLRATPPRATSAANTPNESNPARANRAIRAFQDSRVANNCWQQVLRQNPALRSGAVSISFTVTTAGRFTNMDVTNSPDPRFTQCIRSRSGGIAPLGGGGEVNAQVSVNLTAN